MNLRRIFWRLRPLHRATDAVAVTEFALVLPVMIALGMYATEMAYITSIDMQLSEIALAVGDNASRLGQADNSAVTPTISETDINAVMKGAGFAGNAIGLGTKGRVILTSLERDPDTARQYIHWQRCYGSLAKTSAYGNDTTSNGLTGTPISGVTLAGSTLTAENGSAVMIAEVYYQYTGLFGTLFVNTTQMKQEAAFIIRDQRNISAGLTGTGSTSACT